MVELKAVVKSLLDEVPAYGGPDYRPTAWLVAKRFGMPLDEFKVLEREAEEKARKTKRRTYWVADRQIAVAFRYANISSYERMATLKINWEKNYDSIFHL